MSQNLNRTADAYKSAVNQKCVYRLYQTKTNEHSMKMLSV